MRRTLSPILLLAMAASLGAAARADEPASPSPPSDVQLWQPHGAFVPEPQAPSQGAVSMGQGELVSQSRMPTMLAPPQGPHRGIGRPLAQESWLYRPFSAGWFMGIEQGGPLIDDWIALERGFVGGYRLGWDHSHYWGGEVRFAFASVELVDRRRAVVAGVEADPLSAEHFADRRDAELFQWDVDVLYYPWGNAAWRPYLAAGLGVARTIFIDRLDRNYSETAFMVPLAAGVKYRCNDWLALRFEVTDNIAFGSGNLETTHHLLATGGVEVRFGGSRTAYWPWNPGRHYW